MTEHCRGTPRPGRAAHSLALALIPSPGPDRRDAEEGFLGQVRALGVCADPRLPRAPRTLPAQRPRSQRPRHRAGGLARAGVVARDRCRAPRPTARRLLTWVSAWRIQRICGTAYTAGYRWRIGSSGERGEARGAGGGARDRPEPGGEALEIDRGRGRHVLQAGLARPR